MYSLDAKTLSADVIINIDQSDNHSNRLLDCFFVFPLLLNHPFARLVYDQSDILSTIDHLFVDLNVSLIKVKYDNKYKKIATIYHSPQTENEHFFVKNNGSLITMLKGFSKPLRQEIMVVMINY